MINFDNFFSALDNDAESINIILTTYLEEYKLGHIRFKALFDNESWAELYLLAHSLKGILANFGGQEIVSDLEEIEAHTHASKAPDNTLIESICAELSQIEIQVQQELLKVA